ncbi:MAG: riboflavin synthase [Proteobacteria bacterium]|nr:riboflavin synthase [Pseudomonadota bacterium]
MFTGIITHIGTIEAAEQKGDLTITISCDFPPNALDIGDSVACGGACLTVTRKGLLSSGKLYFNADLSAETVARTAPGMWEKGKKLNLERSLKLGDSLDGHMVSGHVDGVAMITGVEKRGDSHRLTVEAPAELARFITEKGSVTLNGVSLTVNRAEGARFEVNIIPHTWAVTTLGELSPQSPVNLEIDLIARYVARLIQG